MQVINKELLDMITDQAKANRRLRMNFNLHDNLEAKAQRLINAMEPNTDLPIHRHTHTAETYFVIRGKIKVLFYGEDGKLEETQELDPSTGNFGVQIPTGQWHTIEVLESGTVIFEVKDGPYTPLSPENMMKKIN